MSNKEDQKLIGNFRIGKVIGSGTFGKVREGIHIPTGEKVAIKMLQKKKIKSKKDVQRIQKELQILKDIKHPNIISLLDVKQTEKFIYIVTEFVQGQQLYDHIVRKGTLSLNQACKYFSQLYQAVSFIHSKKISHRDIKPQNIIVNGNDLKLIDFGLSTQWSQNKTTMETPCGSPCYAAPEMVLGKKYDCRKVDIWAMGVTLFAMLMGKLPFQHQNTAKLYKMIQHSELQDIKGVPSYVNLLLRAMMQKDPKKRITIKQIQENIWIKDILKQRQKANLKTEWNDDVLIEMQSIFSTPKNKILTEIVKNSISEMSTFYYLKTNKLKKDPEMQSQEFHDGPFHIQFAFKSIQILESFMVKNAISYKWIFPQNQPQLNDKNSDPANMKRKILINGKQMMLKRLKNLPRFIYLPIQQLAIKSEKKVDKVSYLQNTGDKSFVGLDSSRSSMSKYCIETF